MAQDDRWLRCAAVGRLLCIACATVPVPRGTSRCPGLLLRRPGTGSVSSSDQLVTEADGSADGSVAASGLGRSPRPPPCSMPSRGDPDRRRSAGRGPARQSRPAAAADRPWRPGARRVPLRALRRRDPFVNPEPTWRIYDALASQAGVARAVRVAGPAGAAAELVHHDGRRFVWLVNLAATTVSVQPVVAGGLIGLDGVPVSTVTSTATGSSCCSAWARDQATDRGGPDRPGRPFGRPGLDQLTNAAEWAVTKVSQSRVGRPSTRSASGATSAAAPEA